MGRYGPASGVVLGGGGCRFRETWSRWILDGSINPSRLGLESAQGLADSTEKNPDCPLGEFRYDKISIHMYLSNDIMICT